MSERLRVRRYSRALVGVVVVAALAGLTLASAGSAYNGLNVIEPLSPSASPDFTPRFEGTNLWFVELKSPPAVKGTSIDKLKAEKQAFRDAAAEAEVSYTERYAYDKLWNGLSIQVDPSDLSTLNRLPEVKALYPVGVIEAPKEESIPDLQTALVMTGADVAQNDLGFDGTGIKVAVMDTGLDYDHPDLGGDGIARQNSHQFPTARVVTGYDLVGDDYNASESSPSYQPKPHPDPYPDDCNGHGTHVSGIIGASGNFASGGARGVAPGVTYGAYRVFGCDGSTTDDVMIAAMERILADHMNVLNMSIGDAFNNWPGSPTAVASDNLVDNGIVVVASIGNSGANGVYSAGAPGVGNKVIGVASYDNSHTKLPTFTVTPANLTIGYTNAAAAPAAPTSGSLPLAKTGTPTTTDDGCTSAGALPDLTGKAVLIRRGTCGFYEKSRRAQLAGASAVVLYNNVAGRINPTVAVAAGADGQPVTIPVVAVSDTEGVAINNAINAGSQTLNWTDQEGSFPSPTGGLISSFSSYGLTADLQLKPDIGAPGGFIRSTWPLENGAYNTISGTSMASPHVAGAAALLLEAKGWTSPTAAQAASVRGLLQNTAVPAVWSGNPATGILDAVHRQGAGMLKIDKAIQAPVSVTPGKISLGEAGAPFTGTLELTNSSASAITYDLSRVEGIATFGSTFAPSFTLLGGDVAVAFAAPTVTVPSNGTASVGVSIGRPDEGASFKVVYGGYLVLTPQGGGQTLRVPYSGFAADYQTIPVLTSGGSSSCGTNEVQRVAIAGAPTGGSFTLTFTSPAGGASETTGPIAWNATAAAVRTALAALPGIGSTANVNASGGPLPGAAVSVTFQGALACRDIPQMTADGSGLTGGTTPAAAVTTTTGGATSFPKLGQRVGFVSATDLTPTYTFPETGTITYTMVNLGAQFGRKVMDIPTLGVHLDHQATWLKLTVLDAAGNPVVSSKSKETLDPTAFSASLLARNATAGGFFAYGWDGQLMTTKDKDGKTKPKNVPNGQYKLRLEILKALGTAPADVQTYTSPTFTIARP